MKLYRSGGPNPRVVEIFLVQKGVSLETISIDIGSGENRRQPYLAKNPLGETPALELDGGEAISQVTAICEYLEERWHARSPGRLRSQCAKRRHDGAA